MFRQINEALSALCNCEHQQTERIYWLLSLLISAFATIVACAAAVFSFNAYVEAARQAGIAQRALDSSTRPWLFVDRLVLDGPWVIQQGNVSTRVRASMKNYAQSPALGATLVAKILQTRPGVSYPQKETKRVCDEFQNGTMLNSSVIANEAILSWPTAVTTNIDKNGLFPSAENNKKYAQLSLIGCLNYFGLDGKPHQTVAHARILSKKHSVLFNANQDVFEPEDIFFNIDYMIPNDI